MEAQFLARLEGVATGEKRFSEVEMGTPLHDQSSFLLAVDYIVAYNK